ncbi:MAG: CDP-alcohol phosphatidyltransferase family protein [Thermoplasmata archaeon]
MVLNNFRKQVDPLLSWVAKLFMPLSPNSLTWFAFLFAILAAISYLLSWYSPYFILATPALIMLNALFDGLDGKVARMKNKVTAWGDYLDHVLDRYADIIILLGVILSPFVLRSSFTRWNDYGLGLAILSITGTLFASYMGTQAQAVGCGRNYGGLLGRAERLVILTILPVVQWAAWFWNWYLFLTPSQWLLALFGTLGHFTAIQRIVDAHNELKFRERPKMDRLLTEEEILRLSNSGYTPEQLYELAVHKKVEIATIKRAIKAIKKREKQKCALERRKMKELKKVNGYGEKKVASDSLRQESQLV